MPEQPPAGRADRLPLNRDRVVQAALQLVHDGGLPALSMRRLGAELDVEAMALYRHVNGREDLLEAMVSHLTSRLERSADAQLGPDIGWQGYLQWLAHSVRDVAFEHPQVFPLVATRHPAAPWLRPPLRSLEVVEEFLVALTSRGFTDDQAVSAYRAFTSFLVGHLLLDVAQMGASTTEETIDEGGASAPNTTVTLVEFPNVERLADKLSEDRSQEEFESALEDLLDRIDRVVSQ
ncbi:TetR/AcrR family transcriptional regulator [Georgenia yuyongxinii]|uniref:TetR family transcriptional regulator n=1 Tax=Georgenia yuyongxinii TaxID=2589797 RepID=A0A552WTF3_9MICO|nr:TetR/AcrR family transcriptional regulator C-terminal domain-containing protein [Georgenia yuyongxinii]TRW46121.1 TetR family transcriptional regulator [Georgenia yuyongxinii]